MSESRADFFRCIQTQEATNVTVSAGELDGSGPDNCLLQVGPPGHYTCAYMNDSQVRNLIAALQAFLKATIVLVLALLCAGGTMAQSALPDAPIAKVETPKPKTLDKQFYVVFGVLTASAIADGITTQRDQNRGCWESNPIFGSRHPSPQRIAAINAAYLGGQVGLAYVLKRKFRNNRWLRHTWMINPIVETAIHINAAAHNEALTCQ